MGTNLYTASHQWATRPADECYWSLADMEQAARRIKDDSVERTLAPSELRFSSNGDLRLLGPQTPAGSEGAALTYHAFGQLAGLAKAPAGYLRTLPTSLTRQCLENGLAQREETEPVKALVAFDKHGTGSTVVRALTGDGYGRLWTANLISNLRDAIERSGRQMTTPPARVSPGWDGPTREATAEDVGPWTLVKAGEIIRPAGLYYGPSSGRDTFVFLLDTQRDIPLPGGATGYRFLLLWNSETGAASVGGQSGLLDVVCGNHILWDVKDLKSFRFRHVGENRYRALSEMRATFARLDRGTDFETQALLGSARTILGDTKDKALEHAQRITKQPAELLTRAYDSAEEAGRYGDPRSAYSVASGLTQISQASSHAEDRIDLDRAASKPTRSPSRVRDGARGRDPVNRSPGPKPGGRKGWVRMYARGWLLAWEIASKGGPIVVEAVAVMAVAQAVMLKDAVPAIRASVGELVQQHMDGFLEGLKAWEVCGN